MNYQVPHFLKTVFTHGKAVGELAAFSLRDSLLFVEHLSDEKEPIYNASFGDLGDIASPTGRGFCINGTDYLRSKEDTYKNFAVFGSTGSGKSSVIAASNLLTASGQSICCHDPSGQLFNLSAQYLQRKGYLLYVLDLSDEKHSCGINLLDFVTTPSEANKLAAHLVKASFGTKAHDKFWELASTSLLRLLILLLLKMDKSYRTLANVRHLLHLLAGEPKAIDKLMAKHATDEMFLEFKALIRGNEKTLASIIMTAQAALQLWNDEAVCRITAKTTIDFSLFRRRSCALFLKNATFDASYYRPVVSVIMENAIKIYMEHLPVKGVDNEIWFILDETATLSLESLDQVLSNNRKYALGFILFYQNTAQVFNSLGHESGNNLLANCFCKLYLTGADMRTARDLQELLGQTTTNEDGKERVSPLMPAQEIRMLQPNEGLLICGAFRPFKVHLKPFYENPFLRMRTGRSFVYVPHEPIPTTVPLIPGT